MGKKNLLIIYSIIIFSKINVMAADCDVIFSDGFISTINTNILRPLKFIAPILLLVFTTMDFASVVFSDKKDGMTKATSNFGKRTVATLLVFFASNIIGIIYAFIEGDLFCPGLG